MVLHSDPSLALAKMGDILVPGAQKVKMAKIHYFLSLACLALVSLFITGCATKQDLELDRYLRAMEAANPGGGAAAAIPAGPDAPEAPVSSLPPPSMGGHAPADGDITPGDALTIQPDCLLMVNVDEDPSLDGTYTVNNLGAVQLKYVGPVFLFNKTEREAARKIEEVLKMRHFSKATVKVRIMRASYDKVEIAGAVAKPGVIQIGAGDSVSLNDLLLRAGGLKVAADKVRVKVVRGGLQSPLAYSLEGEDHYLVDDEGTPRVPDVRLRNGDIVHVVVGTGRPSAPDADGVVSAGDAVGPKTLLVLGEVRKKGFIQFGPEEPCTMMHLMIKLGGLPPYAKSKAVRVIRRDEDGFEQEFKVDAKRIMGEGNPDDDFPLQDGDRIIVPERRISLF